MRKMIFGFLSLMVFCFVLSCQKELSTEFGTPAKGSLQSALGDCLPKMVAGSYTAAKVLTDSNYIDVAIDVTTAGPYTITTDTVNGYSFKTSGVFSATGTQQVRLKGVGTPATAGNDRFRVTFGSSTCGVLVTVLPAGTTGGNASYTLQSTAGNCASFVPGGNYYKDTTLTTANTVQVQVTVTVPGAYTISTTTVNGYSFSKTGTFGGTGAQTVTLNATGKPLATGTNNFTVTAGTSSCAFSINVTTPPPPATGCTATPQGTYTAGTALTTTNKVVITNTYATSGSYTVSTGTVNGYSFGPVTIAAVAGTPVSVTLTGVGTPTAAGNNNFTVDLGNSSTCAFSVTVAPGTAPPVTNTDYFPLTANSFWSYEDPTDPAPNGDTSKRTNVATATFTGNSYRLFQITDDSNIPIDTFYYRRAANDYFEYLSVDAYSALTFDTPQKGDLLFLKENLATGTTWNSAEFTGVIQGQNAKIRYAFTCTDASATVTAAGKTYTNVYKINMKGQFSAFGQPYQNDDTDWTFWYGKGVGVIYEKLTFQGTLLYENWLRNHKVF